MCFFFPFSGSKRPISLFLTVYKLINGILSSVHRFTASMNTGIDETIRVDQILRSKEEQLGLAALATCLPVHEVLATLSATYTECYPSTQEAGSGVRCNLAT